MHGEWLGRWPSPISPGPWQNAEPQRGERNSPESPSIPRHRLIRRWRKTHGICNKVTLKNVTNFFQTHVKLIEYFRCGVHTDYGGLTLLYQVLSHFGKNFKKASRRISLMDVFWLWFHVHDIAGCLWRLRGPGYGWWMGSSYSHPRDHRCEHRRSHGLLVWRPIQGHQT